MVERKRTPAEIREEFERLQREREERRLQQRTNPKVATTASEDWESQVEVMMVSELTAYKTRWGKAYVLQGDSSGCSRDKCSDAVVEESQGALEDLSSSYAASSSSTEDRRGPLCQLD